jgi:hypothetical protein
MLREKMLPVIQRPCTTSKKYARSYRDMVGSFQYFGRA